MSLEAQVSEAHGTGRAPKVGTDGGCGEKGPWATNRVKKRDSVSTLPPAPVWWCAGHLLGPGTLLVAGENNDGSGQLVIRSVTGMRSGGPCTL